MDAEEEKKLKGGINAKTEVSSGNESLSAESAITTWLGHVAD